MNRGNVVLNNSERFEKNFVISNEKLDKAIEHATNKLKAKMKEYGLKYVSHFPNDPLFADCALSTRIPHGVVQ